MQAAGIDFVDF